MNVEKESECWNEIWDPSESNATIPYSLGHQIPNKEMNVEMRYGTPLEFNASIPTSLGRQIASYEMNVGKGIELLK